MRQPRYQFGEFELDAASRALTRGGDRVALPPKSFECIAYLIAHRERAVGRDELIAAVWGRVEVSDTVVAQTMLRARKALDDTGERQAFVRTVPRFGYQWIAPVKEVVAVVAPEPVAPPMPTPTSTSTSMDIRASRTWRRFAVPLIALLVVAGAWGAWSYFRNEATQDAAQASDLVLVLPVAVAPNDAEDAWVRLGAMDYVASRLRRSGLKVVPSEQTLHLSALAKPGTTDDSTAWKALRANSGARWVVSPEARHDARGWRVRLNVHDGAARVVEAAGSTPLAAAAAATDAWLRRIGRTSGDEGTPSALTERVQRIDAELFVGQLASARRLIDSTPASQRNEPRLRLREGQLEFRAGRVDEASRIFASILQAGESVDRVVRAEALMGSGAVEIRRGEFAKAESLYAQALALLEQGGADDPVLIGNAYNGRGVARVQQDKMDDAVHDMGMARIAMQRSGNLVEAATVGVNLGRIETQRGHLPQALQEFDGAIATFRKFDVRDYLAAAWLAKAEAQMVQVQPAHAAASMAEAATLAKSIEDPYLASAIANMRARTALATGRLRDAGTAIDDVARNGEGLDAIVQELRLRLALARGANAEAGALAKRTPPSGAEVPGSLALAAVQAALRNRDLDTARGWVARAPAEGQGDVSWDVARALLASGEGDAARAIRIAREAAVRMERTGSPDGRVLAGLLHAKLLLAGGQRDEAAAILGDLDGFAGADYRVAWTTLTLYRALGESAMVSTAQTRVQALRGERDAAIEPAL
ncbi:winged helix-turn-helix domain-containing protein [Lysobacter sp. A6]|uniref:Winged helix-turn-helix domain-containing protein n=1 Tax=Noviluteimonas lactosilytica TaxID=2888523 RepID=A0ABS8JIH4_9GAMM|nr:winged helix-turn-helix domain-containing protein [Lysobacter lactosilyticus]MCC8363354.1 winged helix-turn-helix domain-containing protein [Lysobacter lactosilyticus]